MVIDFVDSTIKANLYRLYYYRLVISWLGIVINTQKCTFTKSLIHHFTLKSIINSSNLSNLFTSMFKSKISYSLYYLLTQV